MTPAWRRVALAVGVSALLHVAVLSLLRTPIGSPSAFAPISVMIQEPSAPATPIVPPSPAERPKADRRPKPEASSAAVQVPAPILPEPSVGRRRSPSVSAGPRSDPHLPVGSDLADAATYIDVERLPTWPKLIGRLEADYPARAYELGRKGVVVVQLMVDEDGTVTEAKALGGQDEDLTASALVALRQARFRPAVGPDGKPARARVFYSVSFVLE